MTRSDLFSSRRWLPLLAFLLVVGLHTCLTFYFERPSVVLSAEPLRGEDFDIHFGQATRFIDAFEGWGKTWSYDPSLLAGRPAGTISDANNKAWELWTWALCKAGLPRGLAFNLFALAVILLVPWVMAAAARLFGLRRWPAVLAAFLASLIWFFDSQTHYFWWIGMEAWTLASYLGLLPLGFFYRYTATLRNGWAMATALLLALCLLVHPYVFVALLVPLGALYLRAFRRLTKKQHATVAAIALFAIAANAYWLLTAFRFWHHILDSGYFSQARPYTAFFDFFELIEDPSDTAPFMQTGFRFTALAAALITLVLWRKNGDDRFLPLTLGLGWLIAVSYFGSAVWLFSQIQPYRFIVAATMMAVIPAAALPQELHNRRVISRTPRLVLALGVLLALPALQLLARDILSFFPYKLDERMPRFKKAPGSAPPTGLPLQMDLRHRPITTADLVIPRWFQAHHDGQGRVLVEPGMLGEWLSWKADGLEVLGGFLQRNLQHTDANFFRRFPNRSGSEAELRGFMQTYAVRWVILSADLPFPAKYRQLLRVRAKLPQGVICESKLPVSYFQQGSGRVRASLNRIEVTDTDPSQDLVLRYHWLETLVCRPDCALKRHPVPGDAVGFIRVAAPHPADIVIENGY